jgi:hypothetical protein
LINGVVLDGRGLAEFGMDDLIGGPISGRVPGEDAYYCKAFGRMMNEITPTAWSRSSSTGRC